MNMILAIACGGAMGSVMRHYAIMAGAKLMGDGFPYGTLFVNVLGSFLIGLIMEMGALKFQTTPELRALLVTGLLGGFTTFSAFSFDIFKLSETGHSAAAALYVAASVFASILAVFGGDYIVRHMVS